MPRHSDSNPHFVRPVQPPNQDQHPHGAPFVSLPLHQGQQHSEPLSLGPGWPESRHPEPLYLEPEPRQVDPSIRPKTKRPSRKSKQPVRPTPLMPFHPHLQDQQHPQGQQTQPLVPQVPIASPYQGGQPHPKPHSSQGQGQPHGSQGQPHQHRQRTQPHPHGLHIPPPQQTNLLTWSGAFFCAIFWVVIIIGGIVILIVYLVFRPRSPKFEVTAATLNAAYLDMGYLLNADITVLANFTNPNKKVSVDFSNLIIDLYYGTTRIATQYIEPFSAHKRQSMFANIHMVVSQVRLGLLESQRLRRQMETNRATFEVKGYFRARANLGKILRYSYWLHGDCRVVFSRPPDGVLVSRKCKTKH